MSHLHTTARGKVKTFSYVKSVVFVFVFFLPLTSLNFVLKFRKWHFKTPCRTPTMHRSITHNSTFLASKMADRRRRELCS